MPLLDLDNTDPLMTCDWIRDVPALSTACNGKFLFHEDMDDRTAVDGTVILYGGLRWIPVITFRAGGNNHAYETLDETYLTAYLTDDPNYIMTFSRAEVRCFRIYPTLILWK